MTQRIDAVLLIGFGGPTRSEDIRRFLDQVLRGRPVPKERYEEVVHHYQVMGGRSPYNDLAMRQADALHAHLKRDGIEIPVVVGMRNWDPYLLDTIREVGGPGRAQGSWIRSGSASMRGELGALSWHGQRCTIENRNARARSRISAAVAYPSKIRRGRFRPRVRSFRETRSARKEKRAPYLHRA